MSAIYNQSLNELDGDLMLIQEFREAVDMGCLIDYDGFGHPVRGECKARSGGYGVLYYMVAENVEIVPSRLDLIPSDATHIIWFNR